MIPNNYVLTTLSHNPEYFEDVIALIEEEFHYNENHHYENDFAPLMDPLNFENCFLYVDSDSNTVAAHLALCPRTMIKGLNEFKVALIGGIATKKDHRGKKLFASLIEHALTTHQDKVGLFILWSDLENLYEKFSFSRAGGFIETGKKDFSDGDRPSGFEKTSFPAFNERDFSTIINLYHSFNQQHFLTIKREEKDWSIIREMNSIDVFIKRNTKSEIDKYFCINKGKDLTGIIHEISCFSQDELLPFYKKIRDFKLWLPEVASEQFPTSEIFYTAFMRIGCEKILNSFLEKTTQGKLRILNKENEIISFAFKGELFTTSSKNFLQYVFGPRPLEEFAPFRLSFYISGTDSV